MLRRKLGNARNVLGTHLMGVAAAEADAPRMADTALDSDTAWHRSCSLLLRSAGDFEAVGDAVNQALVKCNLGKLMRVGYLRLPSASGSRRRQLHNRAVAFYREAAEALGRRSAHPQVYDMVQAELAGASLAFAALLQDGAPEDHRPSAAAAATPGTAPPLPPSAESGNGDGRLGSGVASPVSLAASEPAAVGAEQDLADLLGEAITLYAAEVRLAKAAVAVAPKVAAAAQEQREQRARWRLAEAHHRLALLHSRAARQGNAPTHALRLAEHHFLQALELYASGAGRSPLHVLQVRLEWLVLQLDTSASRMEGASSESAALQQAMQTLLGCRPVLCEVAAVAAADPATSDAAGVAQRTALAAAVAKRCVGVLHRLVRASTAAASTPAASKGRAGGGSAAAGLATLAKHKAAYALALRGLGTSVEAPQSVQGHSLSTAAGLQALTKILDAIASTLEEGKSGK